MNYKTIKMILKKIIEGSCSNYFGLDEVFMVQI